MTLQSWHGILADVAAPTAVQPNPTGQTVMMFAYIGIFIAIFYFLTIRPQSKKAKEHAALMAGLKAGDKVITSGGMVGVVVGVKEKTVTIRSADTKIEFLKSAVTDITERGGSVSASES